MKQNWTRTIILIIKNIIYLQGSGCGWTEQSWTILTGVKVNLLITAMEELLLQMENGRQAISAIIGRTSAKHPKVN